MSERVVSISFAESAVGDLEDVIAYYTERNVSDVGQRLVADILSRIESLATHPDMGRVVPEFGIEHLRELIRPPFRIVYRRERDRVRIVRVWRGERALMLP